jgi:hypothetical protein
VGGGRAALALPAPTTATIIADSQRAPTHLVPIIAFSFTVATIAAAGRL